VADWAATNGVPMLNLNGDYTAVDGAAGRPLYYGDGLGLALMQKSARAFAGTRVSAARRTTERVS
jgi:hypothetical protein